MKTAMQELLDHLESYDMNINTEFYKGLLEKEKEQIIDAHLEGWSDAYDYLDGTSQDARQAEDYYNETFNENK